MFWGFGERLKAGTACSRFPRVLFLGLLLLLCHRLSLIVVIWSCDISFSFRELA